MFVTTLSCELSLTKQAKCFSEIACMTIDRETTILKGIPSELFAHLPVLDDDIRY